MKYEERKKTERKKERERLRISVSFECIVVVIDWSDYLTNLLYKTKHSRFFVVEKNVKRKIFSSSEDKFVRFENFWTNVQQKNLNFDLFCYFVSVRIWKNEVPGELDFILRFGQHIDKSLTKLRPFHEWKRGITFSPMFV